MFSDLVHNKLESHCSILISESLNKLKTQLILDP